VIEDGVKLDNQIQIAHNVRIGAHTAIAAFAGIAGSARIGKHCLIGGAARIMGHIEIVDGVTVTATSFVTKSIRIAGTYTAVLPAEPAREWAKTVANLRSLDRVSRRVREGATRSKPEGRKGKR
jgi:UDP-3-O-[3-hydroxymyristoyl] glucosamine N-acyltransferase